MENTNCVIEYIEWLDSQGVTRGWEDLKEFKPELPVMQSIGFVVYQDEKMISLCGNIGNETASTLFQGNGIMTIPKICIVSRKIIEL